MSFYATFCSPVGATQLVHLVLKRPQVSQKIGARLARIPVAVEGSLRGRRMQRRRPSSWRRRNGSLSLK